jgi:hypothetical protein
MKIMRVSAVIALLIGIGAVPALAQDPTFNWTFGTSPTDPYGSGTFDATLVNGALYPGLYQIVSGTGTITDSAGTFSVSVAGLTTSYNGGAQGLCDNVVDSSAVCNTMRGTNGTGQNFTFDNLLYTGASLAGGQPFDANGIAFVDSVVGQDFVLTTTSSSGNSGGAEYCGPGATDCEGLSPTLSVSLVPDGGTTLALLGLAVAGLAGLRRKLSV